LIEFRLSGVRTNDMHHNRKANPKDSVCRMIVRLCVIFCLWQGPVPWLHCHESELASPASIIDLRHHLVTFHDVVALDHDDEFGWHFHWIFPGWSDGFHVPSNDEQPFKGFACLDSIVVCSTTTALNNRLFESDLQQQLAVEKFTDASRIIWWIEHRHLPQRKYEFPVVMRC
jgi:hypothetical protein